MALIPRTGIDVFTAPPDIAKSICQNEDYAVDEIELVVTDDWIVFRDWVRGPLLLRFLTSGFDLLITEGGLHVVPPEVKFSTTMALQGHLDGTNHRLQARCIQLALYEEATTLRLVFPNVEVSPPPSLCSIALSNLPCLEAICLWCRHDIDMASILNVVPDPSKIKKIEFQDAMCSFDHTLASLLRFQNLEELVLGHEPEWYAHHVQPFYWNEESIANLADLVEGMPKLRRLALKNPVLLCTDQLELLKPLYVALGYKNRPSNEYPNIDVLGIPSTFIGDDINNQEQLRAWDSFEFMNPGPDVLTTETEFQENYLRDYNEYLLNGPPFLLALERAQRKGMIPEARDVPLVNTTRCTEKGPLHGGYRFNGELQSWVQAMCTLRCNPTEYLEGTNNQEDQEQDRLNFCYYFLRQMSFNDDVFALFRPLEAAGQIQMTPSQQIR